MILNQPNEPPGQAQLPNNGRNLFYRHVQTDHTILRNFGLVGQARYLIESIGPELRQYLFTNDREERPFNRLERSNVYQKAKNVESASSFGTLLEYDASELKLRQIEFVRCMFEREDVKKEPGS